MSKKNQDESNARGFSVSVIKSRRKTVSIEITREGKVVLRAPFFVTKRETDYFLDEKREWILKHLASQKEKKPVKKMTADQLAFLKDEATERILPLVKSYAAQMKVSYQKVTIRAEKSQWGSCSAGGNLNFNSLLMLAPDSITEYVVVHELCHRKEMNHSARFWNEVERVLPDYKEKRKWLKENGDRILAQLP